MGDLLRRIRYPAQFATLVALIIFWTVVAGAMLGWHLRSISLYSLEWVAAPFLFGTHVLIWVLGLALLALGFVMWYRYTSDLAERMAAHTRAEAVLRASEEQLRLTLEATQDGLWELNFGDRPDFFSDRMFTMLGYEPVAHELGYQFLHSLLHPGDVQAFEQAASDLWSGKTNSLQHEARLRAADGSWRTILNRGRCVSRDEHGQPLRLLGTHTDVSELRHVAQQLELHSAALAAAANAIVITDPNGIIQWVNPAFTRLTGYTAQEAIGQNPRILKSGKNSDDFYRELWDTIQHGRVWHNEELVNRRKDGSYYFEQMTITPVIDDSGAISHYIAVKLDISDRKRAEEALHAQRDFARQVMDTMGEGLAVLNEAAEFEYVNPALARHLGYNAATLLGTPYASILAVDGRDGGHTVADGPRRYEAALRHADDRVTYMLVTEVARVDTGRGGCILVFTDLTKHKQIESDLASARDKAIEASRLKSEFLANMSHEIRTPLNGVIGMTGLLLSTQLSEEQGEYAATIRTSSDSLLSIINDILDFSKIEAGRLELEEQPFSLRECVEEALDLLVPTAFDGGLELAYFVDPNLPEVILGDKTRLRQILINLIGNAVKFTPSGEVTVWVHERMGDLPGLLLEFDVRDTGIGIPADRLDGLFRPFTQVDASTTRRFGGTGLGLTISKHLAKMMGGDMWVESRLGSGSTFHFTLRVQARPGHLNPRPLAGLNALRDKRLLIVDDNATCRTILERYAEAWGMRFTSYADGREALVGIAQEMPFDIALIDARMPGMDGPDLAAALRQVPGSAAMPMVLLTSVGNSHRRDPLTEFAACLTKPVKTHQLARVLLDVVQPPLGLTQAYAVSASVDHPERMGDLFPTRILLAEDNLVNQKVALRMLERLGYTPDLALTGTQVLDALSRNAYDLVLMDVQMPELDGIEATRRIRHETPSERQPYIIAMTAHALEDDREQCLRCGMNDYLSKPVRLENLSVVLQRFQERRRNGTAVTLG